MKKFSLAIGICFSCLFLLSGCTRQDECHICELENVGTSEICREAYPDNSSYQLTVDALEDAGYTCNKK